MPKNTTHTQTTPNGKKIPLIHTRLLSLTLARTQFAMFIQCFSLTSQKQRDITVDTQRSQLTAITICDTQQTVVWHEWSDVLLVRVYWLHGTASLSTSSNNCICFSTRRICVCMCVCVCTGIFGSSLKSKCVVNDDDDDGGGGYNNSSSVDMREWQQRLEPTTIIKHENKTDALTQITENSLDNNYNRIK